MYVIPIVPPYQRWENIDIASSIHTDNDNLWVMYIDWTVSAKRAIHMMINILSTGWITFKRYVLSVDSPLMAEVGT